VLQKVFNILYINSFKYLLPSTGCQPLADDRRRQYEYER